MWKFVFAHTSCSHFIPIGLLTLIGTEYTLFSSRQLRYYATAVYTSVSSTGTHSISTAETFDSVYRHSYLHTLGSKEANLSLGCIKFVKATESDALTVTDPIVGKVTESHNLGTGTDGRYSIGGVYRATEQGIVSTIFQSGLPEILTVLILQKADSVDGRIVHQPYSVLAVRCAKAVIEVHNLISGDGGSGCSGNANISALGVAEQIGRFTLTITGEKCDFLGIGNTTGKFAAEITLKVECRVIEQLLGNLDKCGEFVSIKGYKAITSPLPLRMICAYALPQSKRCVIIVSRKLNEVISGFGSSWSR